jgi:PAS domain S-box-containing protein
MIEFSPSPAFAKDREGRYLFANRAFASRLQREAETLQGLTDADLFPAERASAHAASDRQVLETQAPLEIEDDLPTPEGIRTSLTLRFPLRDAAGNIHAVGGILTDITARKQAESSLRESERLRQRILDTSPQIVYVLDLQGPRIVYLSRRVEDYLGASPETLLQSSPLGLLARAHPSDREQIDQALAAWRSTEDTRVRTSEYRLRDNQGRWRWFLEHSAVFLRHPTGEVAQVIGVVQDVTEQKAAEITLRNRARLGLLEAHLGKILSQDLPLDEMLGRCLQSIRDRLHLRHASLWFNRGTPDLHAPAGTAAQTCQTGTPLTDPPLSWIQDLQRTGQPAIADVTEAGITCRRLGMPLLVNGQCLGVLILETAQPDPQDLVTPIELVANRLALGLQRRQAEMEIRRLNTDLERRVQERTEELRRRVAEAELLNRAMVNVLEDLQRAQQAAENFARNLEAANTRLDQANQELEAFSYSVSHDLRAPLRNVAGFIELLERLPELEDRTQARQYVHIIDQETRRMGQLIDHLLEFSRLSRTELRRQTVEMTALAQQAWDSLGHDRANRTIEWTLDPLPTVQGDAALLSLVWVNLLSNALKYTRTRPVATIHVGTEPVPESPDEICFFVRDNGVGFDMNYAHKLFKVFQRLHRASEFEGTGIGLANVHRILHRHSGRIWAEARKDQGATFWFSLPSSTS